MVLVVEGPSESGSSNKIFLFPSVQITHENVSLKFQIFDFLLPYHRPKVRCIFGLVSADVTIMCLDVTDSNYIGILTFSELFTVTHKVIAFIKPEVSNM